MEMIGLDVTQSVIHIAWLWKMGSSLSRFLNLQPCRLFNPLRDIDFFTIELLQKTF